MIMLMLVAACTQQQPTESTQLTQIKFVSEDPQQCATLRFTCEEGFEAFNDERGCGCTPIVEGKKVPIYCEDPRPEVCTREYMPVCGFLENAQGSLTAGNKCEACANPQVDYYVEGVCPQDLAAS